HSRHEGKSTQGEGVRRCASWIRQLTVVRDCERLRLPEPPLGLLSPLGSRPLSERKWDQAHGEQQKQVKCASKKMRLTGGVDLSFHPLQIAFQFLTADLIQDGRREFFTKKGSTHQASRRKCLPTSE